MSVTPGEIRDAVDRYFAARNSMDSAASTACFTEDATMHDPYGSTPIEGAGAIRAFFDGLEHFFVDFKVVAEEIYPSGNRAAVIFRRTGVGKNGKPLTVGGVHVFEFNHAARITNLWSYWDAAAVLAQLKS